MSGQTKSIVKLPRFVPHGNTIVENESTGRRLADLSEVCRRANAHEELLEALKELVAAEEHESGGEYSHLMSDAIDRAQTAIAKAEGR